MAAGRDLVMTARDWVGLAVRVIGFWLMVQGVLVLLGSIPYLHSEPGLSTGTALLGIWPGRIAMIIIGGWMLFRTDGIVRRICGASTGRGK